MVFRHFRFQIALRVLFIVGLAALCMYLFFIRNTYVASGIAGLLLIGTAISLVHYTERSNRHLSRFLLAIRHRDYSAGFEHTEYLSRSGEELNQAFHLITSDFQRIHIEKEVHYEFLQTVVAHIPIGIICMDNKGEIVIFNDVARTLIGVSHLPSFSHLEKIHPRLYAEIQRSIPEQSFLFRSEQQDLNLQIRETQFVLDGSAYRLISLQNIRNELDFQEMESWQKLIRVLTHEIMNSVTPISSLSDTLNGMLHKADGQPMEMSNLSDDEFTDICSGIGAIRNRSKGLLGFVNDYRKFIRVPTPEYVPVKVPQLLNQVSTLMKPKMETLNIHFDVQVEREDIYINVDRDQVEQVLINLIYNAIDALENKQEKRIRLSAFTKRDGSIAIAVEDNGVGIEKENINKIFIPFFTTKEKGSGIGLSLSRQLILINKGVINVQSTQAKGTVFEIVFSS